MGILHAVPVEFSLRNPLSEWFLTSFPGINHHLVQLGTKHLQSLVRWGRAAPRRGKGGVPPPIQPGTPPPPKSARLRSFPTKFFRQIRQNPYLGLQLGGSGVWPWIHPPGGGEGGCSDLRRSLTRILICGLCRVNWCWVHLTERRSCHLVSENGSTQNAIFVRSFGFILFGY